ncbi:porin family protein [Faecalibacter macacae]|uniref:Porin family protein n=1 Tax=Faecalibacter macacae TaxID=1859289 RepID=A0A3L9MIR5_9FLAO|nr:porin family protein [Faecalibacter macacae]RLZ12046.1 porin family protein [Faecalibacter macacae]
MKKLILAVTLLAFGANVNAQEQTGLENKWFVMGQAGYSSTNEGDSQSYSILPAVGNFVTSDIAIGAAVGYVGSKSGESQNQIKNNLFIIQPFARKYWSISNNFHIFGQAAIPVGFGNNKYEVYNYTEKIKYTTYGIEVAPGFDYFFSPNWSLEATFGLLGWNAVKPEEGDAVNTFNFGINSGLIDGVKVGIKYIF